MLLDFSVENFKSIKELKTFTMVATSIKDKQENTFAINNKLSLLKSSVIYGANGSGKSNIIDAMKFMRVFVGQSAEKDFKNSENLVFLKSIFQPYKLSTNTKKSPSIFEVNFIVDDVRYRYGFELDYQKIYSEWLFSYPKKVERKLFKREFQNIDCSKQNFKEGIDLIDKTRDNALFLSVVANFNGKISKKIKYWFNTFNITRNTDEDGIGGGYTNHKILESEENKEKILKLLKVADLGISDVEIEKISFKDLSDELKEDLDKLPEEIIKRLKEDTPSLINTKIKHMSYNENGEFIGYENFNIDDESIGTQKFYEMCGPIIEVLEEGEILVVDELDNSFHTLMTEFIIKLFNSSKTNPNNAQLIFATHDTKILKNELFRKDQVWFSQKDIFGASDYYSLIEFGTKKVKDIEDSYLSGLYGAIPMIQDI
jgi:AAA15 family ATPase/GTPase